MRELFVKWLEWLLGLFVILSFIGLGVRVWQIATSGMPSAWLAALTLAGGGAIAIIVTYGFIYVLLAIQSNTRRTAIATEALLRQSDRRSNPVMGPKQTTPPVEGDDEPPRRPRSPVVMGPVRPDGRR